MNLSSNWQQAKGSFKIIKAGPYSDPAFISIFIEYDRKFNGGFKPLNYSAKQALESAFHNHVDNFVDNHVDKLCKCAIIAPLDRIAQGLRNR
ncbi:MAG: hypothetical protein ABFD66_14040 [Smithella sp.]